MSPWGPCPAAELQIRIRIWYKLGSGAFDFFWILPLYDVWTCMINIGRKKIILLWYYQFRPRNKSLLMIESETFFCDGRIRNRSTWTRIHTFAPRYNIYLYLLPLNHSTQNILFMLFYWIVDQNMLCTITLKIGIFCPNFEFSMEWGRIKNRYY